ncbi:MAG: hypothetical protein AAF628_18325 [Planctomycetota bacterium]
MTWSSVWIRALPVLAFAAWTPAQSYAVVELGPAAPFSESAANAINAHGAVAGYVVAGGRRRGAVWDDRGTVVLELRRGQRFGEALDLSDNGTALGYGVAVQCRLARGDRCEIEILNATALLWRTRAAVPIERLLRRGSPLRLYEARKANALGDMVGRGYRGDSFLPWQAWVFARGAVTELGTLSGSPGDQTDAESINDLGQVVGRSYVAGWSRAFVWANGRFGDLHEHPAIQGQWSWARDINNAGDVVGQAKFSAGAGGWSSAALWRDGTVVDVGAGAPAFIGESRLDAINDLGVAVGFAQSRRGIVAVRYRGGQLADLNDEIDPAAGWTLLVARDINDRGQIVGQGVHQGRLAAFRLDPLP